jgi:hypothetical protein
MRPFLGVSALVGALMLLPSGASAATSYSPYVAMGDSYTSAPLVPFFPTGDPIGCVRSTNNYPSDVARAIGAQTFRDVSCQGATANKVFEEQVITPGGTNPPEINAVTPDTKLVTVGMGGNDAGLVGLGIQCGELDINSPTGHKCVDYYNSTGHDSSQDDINSAAPRIAAIITAVRARAPQARILIVGYPAVAPTDGTGCWPLVPISPQDMAFVDGALRRINLMLSTTAVANHAEYVDTYTPSIGHDVCKLPLVKWFEGLIPTSIAFPLHPNIQGELSMANSVLRVLQTPPPLVNLGLIGGLSLTLRL